MKTKSTMHLDANETAFLRKYQLEHVKSKTYDTKYKNLKAKMFLPVSTEAPAGADFITYQTYSMVGKAKILADYAGDIPRSDAYAEEQSSKVYSIALSYGYSIKEIRRAQNAKTQLTTKKAQSCRLGIEQKIDSLAWNGDTDYDIQGFLDYPGISEYSTPNGAGGTPEWSTKTPDEIIADLIGIMSAVSVPTKGVEMVNQIILPRSQYEYIAGTRMTDGSTTTILTFFTNNHPGVAVDVLDLLAGSGAAGSDRMMAYVKDPNNVTLELPMPFTQYDAQQESFEYVIPCEAEIGGVIVYYPESVAFADDI